MLIDTYRIKLDLRLIASSVIVSNNLSLVEIEIIFSVFI